jgi:SAM-dependent methyltransferase
VKGIPILLEEKHRVHFSREINTAKQMQREFELGFISKLLKITKKMIGSTLNLPVSSKVKEIWAANKHELFLEVGSGITEGGHRQINLDMDIFGNVDVVASVTNIPFENSTFKLIKNVAVLEHINQPFHGINEIYRVLKPGGFVYTVVPFMLHFHGYPNDYQRYTVEGLKELFRKFEVIETGVRVGPSSAITTMIADWFELFSFTQNRLINDLFRMIPLFLLLPLKYFDYLLVKNSRSHEIAQAIYLLCKKPTENKSFSQR